MASGRKLRVLILVDGIGVVGGGERFARALAVHLSPDRFERTLCVSRWSAEAAEEPAVAAALEEIRAADVRFLGLERRSRAHLGAWRPLANLVRRGEVDVLHAHKFGSNVSGAVISAVFRPPVFIAHEQTWSFEGKRLRRLLDRNLVARVADRFIAVSDADRQRMIDLERIPPNLISVIPNAIAPSRSSGHDVRAELGLRADEPVIGVVCVLRDQKALPTLLEALVTVRSAVAGARLVIVGDGPERPMLERMITELGLADAVLMTGARSDVADLLAAFDVAALSSDFEGTPLAVMEYMAAAKPIVATAVGGVPMLIEDGVHGTLVPPRDPAALAHALVTALSDPESAAAMGARARERQRELFDIEVTAARVGDLYEALYAEASSS